MNKKITLLLVFFLFPILIFGQTSQKKKKSLNHRNHKVQTQTRQSFYEFYKKQHLQPDSALTPYLFYQVYDWAGTRYKYAGKTKNGIDCSGFVSEIYRNTYCINLSGCSRDIWPTVTPIEKNNLHEGDILFFKIKKGQISHVGIYLGNNKFAHSSVAYGVIISDLDEDYYKKYFFKGGRVQGTVNSQ